MSRELLQQALDALKYHTEHTYPFHLTNVAIEALQKALAQPKQEPVGWFYWDAKREIWVQVYPYTDGQPLYTAPPRTEWVGLTDEEILSAAEEVPITCIRQRDYDLHFAPIIEAKLKQKNGGS
jgi:hypothetical protein